MSNHPIPSWRLLREPQVIAATGYSRASIRRLAKLGLFPAPLKLGCGQGGAIAWREDEIVAWVNARQAGRPWAPNSAPEALPRAAQAA
jgi:predicted DNA-binding transcriptional regulator AlpA